MDDEPDYIVNVVTAVILQKVVSWTVYQNYATQLQYSQITGL